MSRRAKKQSPGKPAIPPDRGERPDRPATVQAVEDGLPLRRAAPARSGRAPRAAVYKPSPKARMREVAGVCALLVTLVFVVFGQTLRFDFVNYDDDRYVYGNSHVTNGLTPVAVAQAFSRRDEGLWTPVVAISHMLDCQLYGLNAGGHHLTNILLHLASAILLFLVLRQMTGSLWRSAFVAAVFAIHPLRVESVAWVSERKDVLSGLFFMLTLGAYAHYARRPNSAGRYPAVLLPFCLGLMCKPMLVTAPFVLLLLDYWPLNRLIRTSLDPESSRKTVAVNWRALGEKIPLLALSCGICMVTLLGPKEPVDGTIEPIPFITRIAEAPVWFVQYLGEMIWPAGLAVVYTHHEASLPWWPAALALLGSLSIVIFRLRRTCPYLWMGWLWNLGMLLPVSGIVQISRHARADHYNYLPQIGIYIGLTWAAAEWSQGGRYRRAVLAVVAAVVLSLLMAVAYRQASWWRNGVTVWTHTIQCTTDNFVAHCALGYALYLEGRTGEAIFQYRESLRINPAYPLTYYNLGVALAAQGKTEEAIAQYRESLRINSASPLTHYNLGVALAAQGKTEEAIAQFHEALRINPGYTDAHNNLGNALARQGKTEEAIAQFHEALRIDPAFIGALNNLGIALARQGKTNEAIAQFHEALRIDSAYPETLNNLGLTLDRQGQTAEAIARYREALRINPRYTDAQTNLGNALLEQGQIEEAILDYREAVRIDPSDIVARNCLGFALSAGANEGSHRSIPESPRSATLQYLDSKSVRVAPGHRPGTVLSQWRQGS